MRSASSSWRRERVALAAQLLNRGDRFLYAVVEPPEDFCFFGAGKGQLSLSRFFFTFVFSLQSSFTGSIAARRDASCC